MTVREDYGPKTALDWLIRAMNEAADRVNKIAASDLPSAFTAIGEAVSTGFFGQVFQVIRGEIGAA